MGDPARHRGVPRAELCLPLQGTDHACISLSPPLAAPPPPPPPPHMHPRTRSTRTLQALSFASPKAVLTALFPRPEPASSAADSAAARVAAYRRYIAALERRGAEAVPEFPAGAQWLNAPPLRLGRELQGRVVLLDFWTFCCINCMHILPDLAALERKYSGDAVTVVGVHSAKFDNEKDSQAIRNAVLRCGGRTPATHKPLPGAHRRTLSVSSGLAGVHMHA